MALYFWIKPTHRFASSVNADGTAHHEQPPEAAEIRKKQKYPCNRRFRQRQDPVLCETVAYAMYVKGFSNIVYRH